MATKFGLIGGGIPERRVRPVWDAVDSRQYKSALKLAGALLTKYPNSPYVLALKALILERMGKTEESLTTCLSAKELLYSDNAVHFDDLTLSTLQIVFHRLDHLEMATACYEHACSKYPNNLELMMGLFNSYVKEQLYVKQQQTAIKMYKTVGEERFLLWAVCSVQLQVLYNTGGEKLLPLAEALLKKHISAHSLHEPEALLMYISILEQQMKYDDALEVLSGGMGSLVAIENDKLRMQGRLLARAHNYTAAAEAIQKVLLSCPDDWESFLHYLGCLLEMEINWPKPESGGDQDIYKRDPFDITRRCNLSEDLLESRLLSARELVDDIQKKSNDDFVRGPYLAIIEIERLRRIYSEVRDAKFLEALFDYFDRFGHLSCAASDVEKYLDLLVEKEKAELLEKVSSMSQESSTSSLTSIGWTVTAFKTQQLLGSTFTKSPAELEAAAIILVEMFCKSLPLSRDLDPQENMHGEELLCIVCDILVQLFWRSRKLGYLLEAVLVLEFGLTIRRYVWPYKIRLLHLYSYMGALSLAYEWYLTLEVKNILFESMLHHILPAMLRSPFISDAAELVNDYLRFMDDYFREAGDLTCLAYRHRNYSKAVGFVQFKERLQHSFQYAASKFDSVILQMKGKADTPDDVECILDNVNHGLKYLELLNEERITKLTFNEDLVTRPWWTPTTGINFLSEPFNDASVSACLKGKLHMGSARDNRGHDLKEAERKLLVPRLVYLSEQACSAVVKNRVEHNGTSSDISIVKEMKLLLGRYAGTLGFATEDAINLIASIALGNKSIKDLPSDVISWSSFAVFVNAWNLWSSESLIPSYDGVHRNSWQMVDFIMSHVAQQLVQGCPVVTSPGNDISTVVQFVTEPISWHILIIQCCLKSLVPAGKKKKKGSGGTMERTGFPHLDPIQTSLQCLIGIIQDIRKWLEAQLSQSDENGLQVLLSSLDEGETEGASGRVYGLLQSYSSMSNADHGERISGALKSWNSVAVLRKLVGSHRKLPNEIKSICISKLKLLESLKQSIS